MKTNAGRIIDFEQTGTRTQRTRRTTETTSTRSSSTSSTARARADIGRKNSVTAEAEAKYAVFTATVAYFEDSIGQRAGLAMKEQLREAILSGCSEEVLRYCIDEASAAPMPSWGYARAVLRRCMVDGILTPEDLERDQARRADHRRRNGAAANPAANFMQREYKAEDFEWIFNKDWMNENDSEDES